MKIEKNKMVYANPKTLIPYINNPRDITQDAVNMIASSIKNYGFDNPIIIDENNEIINGHVRLQAALKLKLEEVPVIQKTNLTEAQKKAYRIADNKVATIVQFDPEMLRIEVEGIKELDKDIEIQGFSEAEIESLFTKFDEEEVGDIDEYEEPKNESDEEQYLKCPHCGEIEKKNLFEEIEKHNLAKIDCSDPEIRFATENDIDGIKKIADKLTKLIGFVLRPILLEAAQKKELLVALDKDKIIAFCRFHIRRDKTTVIYEIATEFSYRKNGIAKKLIDEIPKPIQLKCPVGNPSNEFYKNIGAKFLEEQEGKKRSLNLWEIN